MADRVKALKLESPDSGGTQLDEFPASLDPNEDHLDARGLFLQGDATDDEAVHIGRDAADNLTFRDAAEPAGKTLSDLLAGGMGEDTHRQLDQLTHAVDETHDVITTFSGGVIADVLAQVAGGGTAIRRVSGLSVDQAGVVATATVTQYDASGAQKERLDLVVSNPGMPGAATWMRT